MRRRICTSLVWLEVTNLDEKMYLKDVECFEK